MILLDTDLVTLLFRGAGAGHRHLADRLDTRRDEPIATTIVTYEEQTRGWLAYVAKASSMQHQIEAYWRLEQHVRWYRTIVVVGFDEAAAIEFQGLRKARVRIGTMDLKIASIALARGATLLTRNLSDFGKVPGLKAEDWSAGPDDS